jgi:hypothetical protein
MKSGCLFFFRFVRLSAPKEGLDANILIGTENAGILTQLEQWFSPYHIPI